MNKLLGIFYAPSFDTMFELSNELMNNKKLNCSHWSITDPLDIVDTMISEYYQEYTSLISSNKWMLTSRTKINTKNMLSVACDIIKFMSSESYFKNKRKYPNQIIDGEDNVIAKAKLTKEYYTMDRDCYETAGGYRKYVADINTDITIELTSYNNMVLNIPSSLIEDHYNSNFFGVSTGNGTKKYNRGVNVYTRKVTIDKFSLEQIEKNIDIDNIVVDYNKAQQIAKNNIEKYKEKIYEQNLSTIY